MAVIADCTLPGVGHPDQAAQHIVVHCMAEFLDLDPTDKPALEFLRSQGLSAHILVQPSGTLVRMLPDATMGAHAKGFNRDCLGIEFLVPGVHTWGSFLERIKTPYLTEAQWESGVTMVRNWIHMHEIDLERVQRHSDISPGRKFDPGDGFPWEKFLEAVSDA